MESKRWKCNDCGFLIWTKENPFELGQCPYCRNHNVEPILNYVELDRVC